jgi:glycosyl transferase family 2
MSVAGAATNTTSGGTNMYSATATAAAIPTTNARVCGVFEDEPSWCEVVDASSTDDTVSVVQRFPFAQLLEGTPHPVASGRNLAGRSASGDVLIFLDADIRLSIDFFESFLEEFEDKQLDVACPQ